MENLLHSHYRNAIFAGTMGVGKRVKAWREARHLSQLELAKASGISQSRLSIIESDEQQSIQKRTKRKLASALGIEFEQLDAMPEPPGTTRGGSRREVNDLLKNLRLYMLDGDLTQEEIIEELYNIQEERRRRGLTKH